MTVAVLFARTDSVYRSLPDVEVYDIERDARTFAGGMPVVAHPPCRAALWPRPGAVSWCGDGEHDVRLRIVRIVLTIAHLDHQPEHNDPANLRAWCQRCHVTYDAQHHAATARRTRRQRLAIGELFP